MKIGLAAHIAAYIRNELIYYDKTVDHIDQYMILEAIASYIGDAR